MFTLRQQMSGGATAPCESLTLTPQQRVRCTGSRVGRSLRRNSRIVHRRRVATVVAAAGGGDGGEGRDLAQEGVRTGRRGALLSTTLGAATAFAPQENATAQVVPPLSVAEGTVMVPTGPAFKVRGARVATASGF